VGNRDARIAGSTVHLRFRIVSRSAMIVINERSSRADRPRRVTAGLRCEWEPTMAKYGKKASRKVKRAMHERKHGTLRSGRSGKKVTSRKQAIAIGLAEARREGAKVPPKPSGKRRSKRSAGD
jgi:hypothetical protein